VQSIFFIVVVVIFLDDFVEKTIFKYLISL